LWISLFDYDHTLALDDLGLHLLLLARFQITGVLRLLAHALHSIHQIALLRQESVAQIGGPLDVVCQALDYIGQSGHRLDTWIPGLLRDGIGECLILEPGIPRQPLLELDQFERVRGSYEGLG
jgi:hypothetical protein